MARQVDSGEVLEHLTNIENTARIAREAVAATRYFARQSRVAGIVGPRGHALNGHGTVVGQEAAQRAAAANGAVGVALQQMRRHVADLDRILQGAANGNSDEGGAGEGDEGTDGGGGPGAPGLVGG